ncbi:MAG: hypothetical protein OXN17_07980 [Candidatus Poribacteria bacterium]|nr:hypothetical protein [Candidatus Poribacteria bacterium]
MCRSIGVVLYTVLIPRLRDRWSGVTTSPDDYTGLGRKITGRSDSERLFRVDRNTDGVLAVRDFFSVRLRFGRGNRVPTAEA